MTMKTTSDYDDDYHDDDDDDYYSQTLCDTYLKRVY